MSPNLRCTAVTCAVLVLSPGAFAVRVCAAPPTQLTSCGQSLGAGNYVVTRNLASSGTCFTITSSNVAVDMKGNTISGDGTGSAFTDGGKARSFCIIANGKITNFDTGISFSNSSSFDETINNVRVLNNAGDGIFLAAGFSSIANTKANGNGGDGIDISECCNSFVNVQANGNKADGIFMSSCCSMATNVTAKNNTDHGIELDDSDNSVQVSIASGNGMDGIHMTGDENFVNKSTASDNKGNGIYLEDECCGLANQVIANRNGGNGLFGGSDDDLITNSTFNENKGDGIEVDASNFHSINTVTANSNKGAGVSIDCGSNLTKLNAHGNGGGNLVESGTCTELNNNTK